MSEKDWFDGSLLKAIGHPLRLRLLELIADTGEASPKSLAGELDQPLATISHHVRLLRDLGFIELARTEPRRGAVEHFYRAVRRPFLDDAQWEQLPVALRRGLSQQTFRMIFAEASQSGADGGFDEPGFNLLRMPLEMDERGRRELSDALTELLRQAEAIQRRSDERRAVAAAADGAAVTTSLVLLHYRAPDPANPTEPGKGRREPPEPRPRLP